MDPLKQYVPPYQCQFWGGGYLILIRLFREGVLKSDQPFRGGY